MTDRKAWWPGGAESPGKAGRLGRAGWLEKAGWPGKAQRSWLGCFWFSAVAFCVLSLSHPLPSHAQQIDLSDLSPRPQHPQRVSFDPEPILLPSGKPEWIELRFHVAPGFHVNSHTPQDETLIPTSLQISKAPQIRLLQDIYPAGTPLHLAIGTGETLSTYEGEFRVRLQIIAQKGDSTLAGALHYQACNAASCFPPRDLPISVPLSAR